MKRLLISIFGFTVGKVITETRRVELGIPDSVWNNAEVFEEITLTYSELVSLLSPYLPSTGTGKPTTEKFQAYVKLYGLSLYLNNKEAFDAETFVFEDRWQPTGVSNRGFIPLRRGNQIYVEQVHSSNEGWGVIFKNEEDVTLVIELLGSELNNIFI